MTIAGKRKVTPSQPDYWIGTPQAGSPFTRQQQVKAAAMAEGIARNVRLYGLPTSYTVVLGGAPNNTFNGRPPEPAQRFECPVIGCTKDRTRLRIIARNGMDTWVNWEKSR